MEAIEYDTVWELKRAISRAERAGDIAFVSLTTNMRKTARYYEDMYGEDGTLCYAYTSSLLDAELDMLEYLPEPAATRSGPGYVVACLTSAPYDMGDERYPDPLYGGGYGATESDSDERSYDGTEYDEYVPRQRKKRSKSPPPMNITVEPQRNPQRDALEVVAAGAKAMGAVGVAAAGCGCSIM